MDESLEIKIARLEEKLAASQNAVILQAQEYERRLEELNHARREQAGRDVLYVSRESWEARRREIDIQIADLIAWRNRSIGLMVGVGIGAGLTGGGVSALLVSILK